jgi:hypothetical protein
VMLKAHARERVAPLPVETSIVAAPENVERPKGERQQHAHIVFTSVSGLFSTLHLLQAPRAAPVGRGEKDVMVGCDGLVCWGGCWSVGRAQ